MKTRVPSFFLCLALCSAFVALAAAPDRDDPKPAWRNGPVRIILTTEEDKACKALATDEERVKWIADFWTKRDPSPGTPENEYKNKFYEWVDKASTKYREAGTPGWSTERGKLFLMAGPPDAISGADSERETWTYNTPLPGKNVPNKVVFEKSDETYRVSEGQILYAALRGLSPEAVMRFALRLKEGETMAAGGKGPGATGGKGPGAAPGAAGGAAAAAGQPAPLSPGVERLRTAVAGDQPVKDLAIQPSARFFKAADGSTDIVIDISVKRADLTVAEGKPNAVVFASLRASSIPDAKAVELTDQNLFTIVDDPAFPWVQYGFSISLPVRPYELRAGISDGPEGKIGTAVVNLQVPDYSAEALTISSITMATSADAAASDLSPDDPFRWGALRLIPRVDPVLNSKDDLSFYYDVYNAKKDGGSATLDVAYMIEKKETSGWVKKLRNPIEEKDQHMEALGYTIENAALVRWPDGDYRVTITVKDRTANAAVNSALEFTLKK